jgi:hypothetical protein
VTGLGLESNLASQASIFSKSKICDLVMSLFLSSVLLLLFSVGENCVKLVLIGSQIGSIWDELAQLGSI